MQSQSIVANNNLGSLLLLLGLVSVFSCHRRDVLPAWLQSATASQPKNLIPDQIVSSTWIVLVANPTFIPKELDQPILTQRFSFPAFYTVAPKFHL